MYVDASDGGDVPSPISYNDPVFNKLRTILQALALEIEASAQACEPNNLIPRNDPFHAMIECAASGESWQDALDRGPSEPRAADSPDGSDSGGAVPC